MGHYKQILRGVKNDQGNHLTSRQGQSLCLPEAA
jgi:hypothetical protein